MTTFRCPLFILTFPRYFTRMLGFPLLEVEIFKVARSCSFFFAVHSILQTCLSSTRSGEFDVVWMGLDIAHPDFSRRSMSRNPRAPKRSPTPTSATFPDMPPPPVPASPGSSSSSKPLYLCSPFVEAALVKGNFKTIVVLPKYVDIMEWVAVNGPSLLSRWPLS